MRSIYAYLVIGILLFGCQKDSPLPDPNNPTGEGEGNIPSSDVSSYDPNHVPQQDAPQENLLANGSFEEDGWVLCGTSNIKTSTEARDGDNYLEINGQGTCEQFTSSFTEQLYGDAYFPINITKTPEIIHVSLYIKASKRLTFTNDPLSIKLLGNISYDVIESRSVSFLNLHSDIIGTGWTHIKMSLKKQEIEDYLGELVPKWLYISMFSAYGISDDITISVDKVRVTYEKEVTQPEPMPENLLNYSGNDQILFVNSDKQVAATMKPNGSNLVNYERIPTETITSTPYWYDNNNITVGHLVVNPPLNTDATVLPASGTELYRYGLLNNTEDLIYETQGIPGRYEFDGSANNLDALNLTVRRVAWDPQRKRGALSVCGQNYTFGFVSDDYCRIYIIDEDGTVLNDQTEGFNAAWSSSGRLAYVLSGSIYVADVSGGTVNSNVVYERGGVSDVVDWSPDGNSIVFMERGGDVVGSDYAEAIKTLDLSTGKVNELVLVDHGVAYPNVSWSNDGNFIIYSLFIPTKSDPSKGYNQIWWVEIATGKTGPITTNINAYGGTFRR